MLTALRPDNKGASSEGWLCIFQTRAAVAVRPGVSLGYNVLRKTVIDKIVWGFSLVLFCVSSCFSLVPFCARGCNLS